MWGKVIIDNFTFVQLSVSVIYHQNIPGFQIHFPINIDFAELHTYGK